MRPHTMIVGLAGPVLFSASAWAQDLPSQGFDAYGAAPAKFELMIDKPDLVIEVGLGMGARPTYEGSTEYSAIFIPIIKPEYFIIPGVFEMGGDDDRGAFSISPSIDVIGERLSDDHALLVGLDNVDTTIALGARVGYEIPVADGLSAEIYGALRYAFGGAEGLVGEAGIDVTARLSPQLEIVGGPVVSFAGEDYMDTYFGISAEGSAQTGGRLAEYDPGAGIKSAGLKVAARYEFVPDTFLSANATYTNLVGDAANSPVVAQDGQHQFYIGIALSRRFSFDLY